MYSMYKQISHPPTQTQAHTDLCKVHLFQNQMPSKSCQHKYTVFQFTQQARKQQLGRCGSVWLWRLYAGASLKLLFLFLGQRAGLFKGCDHQCICCLVYGDGLGMIRFRLMSLSHSLAVSPHIGHMIQQLA